MNKLDGDAADDWVFLARDTQLPPTDLDWCCCFLAVVAVSAPFPDRRRTERWAESKWATKPTQRLRS